VSLAGFNGEVAIVTIPPSTASVIFGLTYNYVAILSD
jgi:hypothetical protein